MWPFTVAVVQHCFVLASGILKRIRQDRQSVERPVLVDSFCKGENGGCTGGRIDYGAKGATEQVTDVTGLDLSRNQT